MAASLTTPGVSIQEIDAFPSAVVAVPTAIPAFIGYTPRADFKGVSYFGKPVLITSLNEFLLYFGALIPPGAQGAGTPASEMAQYRPVYFPVKATGQSFDVMLSDQSQWDLVPDPGTIYYLFNSIRLFYANGGGQCYVVSVVAASPFGTPTNKPLPAGNPLVNSNMTLPELIAGLDALDPVQEVTMIVIPDSVLLAPANYINLIGEVLLTYTQRSRVAILDVQNGDNPDPNGPYLTDISNFRTDVGTTHLDFGIAYYPFLKTAIEQDAGINFFNLGGAKVLTPVLPLAGSDPVLKALLTQMATADTSGPGALPVEKALLNNNTDYLQLHNAVLAKINILPPSGAMAGVYTSVDNSLGVWKAPANVSLVAVTDTTMAFSDSTQSSLNVDALTGKSINVIRLFKGLGVLVWGARTLDGNDLNWRYINVRRTMIMLEQSIKLAMRSYVFAPNVPSTWSLIKTMLTSFLTDQWAQGALAGSTAAVAFTVSVGLGSTMTDDDILNGILNVSVGVAISHPAEFIVLTFTQMQQA